MASSLMAIQRTTRIPVRSAAAALLCPTSPPQVPRVASRNQAAPIPRPPRPPLMPGPWPTSVGSSATFSSTLPSSMAKPLDQNHPASYRKDTRTSACSRDEVDQAPASSSRSFIFLSAITASPPCTIQAGAVGSRYGLLVSVQGPL